MLLLLSSADLKVEKFLVPLLVLSELCFHLCNFSLVCSLTRDPNVRNGWKKNGNLRMQNVTGNETLAAPMYEENPTSLYPHVHIVINQIPVSSNITESQGNDPNVFHSQGNAPLNSIVITHGNAPSTSSVFGTTVLMEMLLILLITEMFRTLMERLH